MIGNGVPSASLSFANKPSAELTFKTVSSNVVFVSATKIGASFTEVILIVNVVVELLVPVPSEIV